MAGRRRLSGHGYEPEAGERAGSEETDEDPWAAAAAAGIHAIAVPTPFAVGRVNVYLVEDEPLTLIDTGPNSALSLDELERGLAARGRALEDLERIVLTHEHVDHTGLSAIIARRSGAETVGIAELEPRLASYSERARLEDDYVAEAMLEHGLDRDVVVALRAVSEGFRAWGTKLELDRALPDGSDLEFADRSLRLILRPGHSPTDTLLWDAERRIAFGGDHLLATVSSNPLMTRPREGEQGRRRALVEYLGSLRSTRELPCEVILAGHGEPVTDHRGLIDSRMRMHERRCNKLLGLLNEGPATAHELARRMWGEVAIRQAFLTLSEVIGHLDLLLDRGEVEEQAGRPVRFARAI